MSISSLSNIWEILSGRPPSGERLTAKPIYTELTQKLYCALDAQNHRHLLVLLNKEDTALTDIQSRGISAITRDLVVEQENPHKYIDIECRDTLGHPAFDLLALEIAELLGKKNLPPAAATSRVLAKWRRFWGRKPSNLLNRREQIGLFAELWFLSKWLIPGSGAEVVQSWCGPSGSRNDFETEKFSVEVKATTLQRGRIYHINDIEQLETPSDKALYFYAMRLREISTQGENLVRVLTALRKMLAEHPDALDHLEEGLALIGYNEAHSEEYKDLRFEVTEECLFEVKDHFPRLRKEKMEIPAGIEKIQYEINLDTFDDLIVAKQPSDWVP